MLVIYWTIPLIQEIFLAKHFNAWFWGTGITPIYQLLCHLRESDVDVKVELMYNNKSEDDILMKEELLSFNFLTITHCFSESDDTAHQPNGRISEKIVILLFDFHLKNIVLFFQRKETNDNWCKSRMIFIFFLIISTIMSLFIYTPSSL